MKSDRVRSIARSRVRSDSTTRIRHARPAVAVRGAITVASTSRASARVGSARSTRIGVHGPCGRSAARAAPRSACRNAGCRSTAGDARRPNAVARRLHSRGGWRGRRRAAAAGRAGSSTIVSSASRAMFRAGAARSDQLGGQALDLLGRRPGRCTGRARAGDAARRPVQSGGRAPGAVRRSRAEKREVAARTARTASAATARKSCERREDRRPSAGGIRRRSRA